MTASLDGDVGKISKVQEQISALAEKMELSKKAMKTVTKLYHAMCLRGGKGCGKIWKLKCSNPAAQLPVNQS